MTTRNRLALEIEEALAAESDHLRLRALRRLASQLLAPATAGGTAQASPVGEARASAYAALYARMMADPFGEIELADFARQRRLEESVAALALLARLPAEASEAAVRMDSRHLLIVVCRSLNFAWSTASALLDLHPSGPPPDHVRDDICEDYHQIEIAQAQRMRRFLAIYFRLSSAPSSRADDDALV